MNKPSKISHPLKNRTGTSQRNRIKQALMFDSAPIDGKTLADRLCLISEYAQQINHYEYNKNEIDGEYQELDNWEAFFKNSLPFQLAILSKKSTENIDSEYLLLSKELKINPTTQSLESLLRFIYTKVVSPITVLFNIVDQAENSLAIPLSSLIKSTFIEPLKSFISLYNASSTFLCVEKRGFANYMNAPWQLKVDDVYALNSGIQQVTKGKKEAFLKADEIIETLFYQMLSGLQSVIESAPDYIEESLVPLEESLQKKHEPHLALLFTFLELFKHFQGNINELGKKHLDFFYEKVLKMIPKEAVPDKAHIVFEIAKHLNDGYPLSEDLLLKDGKDINKENIQFGLDHEIILDKAQVKDLRTFTLNTVEDGGGEYIEGVYTAPVANSADGKGEKFKKEQSVNWATLGAKSSKFIEEGNTLPNNQPNARLGFALASPVLLLQEGERIINILLTCNSDSNFLSKLSEIYDEKRVYDISESESIINDFNAIVELEFEEDLEKITLSNKHFKDLLEKKVNGKIYEDDLNQLIDEIKLIDGFTESMVVSVRTLFGSFTTSNVINVPLFKFTLSGEKEWLEPKEENTTIFVSLETPLEFVFEIQIDLEIDFPAVTFFNEEVLKEKLDLKKSQPVLKIELNEEVKINIDSTDNGGNPCCLKKEYNGSDSLNISPYHYLKQLKLANAEIDVAVCGVKNLIVQNDESALDVKSEIFPFGLRPNVSGFDPMNQLDWVDVITSESLLGPSFYIGSKEVLYKKWDSVRVNIEWKNKPDSFHDYYKAYLKEANDPPVFDGEGNPIEPTDITKLGLDETEFKLKIDKLENGSWEDIKEIELFSKTDTDFGNLCCETTVYGWEVQNNEDDSFVDFNEPLDLFKTSLNGFLKFTLANQDFLHSEYPFVLARQMLAYALSSQGGKLTDAVYVKSDKTVIVATEDFGSSASIDANLQTAIDAVSDVKSGLDDLVVFINDNREPVDIIIGTITTIISSTREYIEDNLPLFQTDLEHVEAHLSDGTSVVISDTIIPNIEVLIQNIQTVRNALPPLEDSDIGDVNEEVDSFIIDLGSFFITLLNILVNGYQEGGQNIDGLESLGTTVSDAKNTPGISLADLLLAIDVPVDQINEGVDRLITLVNENNDAGNSDSLLSKIEEIRSMVSNIVSFIVNDFDTFLENLTSLNGILIGEIQGLISRFENITTQLTSFNDDLYDQVVEPSLREVYNSFIDSILNQIGTTDNDNEEELIDFACIAVEALEELNTAFDQANILSFLFSDAYQALIPNEPWTPVIKNLYIDYSATATKEDLDIIHLYPYKDTSRVEDIEQIPTLFPFFSIEGTLFIGIENLTPGGGLSILFQLAEATADSEKERAEINWHYLSNNKWENLDPGFDIISDETDGLTVSGIVTIAVPRNINKEGNTLMSDSLYWIKVSAPSNIQAVAETIGIHTQAAKTSARFTALNDRSRLDTALEAGGIAKLVEGDFSIKKVEQLYPSFGGVKPEAGGHFYTRVSEHLKHKGRALTLSDYEKIVLEGFPDIYKVKCISHTMGLSAHKYRRDLEIAPGYVVVTVIPDLTKLKSGNQLEPKVPVSLLEKIGNHIRKKTSPFARLKVMNPRYEYIDVLITVRLFRGKSSNFYTKKLKEDIAQFLAPWFLGDSEKLAFGQQIIFSDVVGFVEQLDYVDFISNLELKGECDQTGAVIKPLTARSILTAGEVYVDINEESCEPNERDENEPETRSINQTSELI